jgi:uncharacterized protein (DUF1330 family)
MAAYALAHLRATAPHAEVLEYMRKIQATLDPHSGRFIVHGGAIDVREGSWPGVLVMIEFPDMGAARSWYESAAYQAILPLRTRHTVSDTILVEGVESGHDSARMASQLEAAGWLGRNGTHLEAGR